MDAQRCAASNARRLGNVDTRAQPTVPGGLSSASEHCQAHRQRDPHEQGGLAIAEAIIAHLVAAGVPESEIVDSYNSVTGSVVGFVSLELAQLAEKDNPDWAANTAAQLAGLDARRYPNLVRYMDRLADRAFSLRWTTGADKPFDESYEYLIDRLIDGIKSRVILGPKL
jgi:hypothetical protein